MFNRMLVVEKIGTMMIVFAMLPIVNTITAVPFTILKNVTPASLETSQTPIATDNFYAHLNGAANVPAIATTAQGQALFMFSKDSNTLYYKIIAANIEAVFASHIHCAPAGANGPVGVTLFFSNEPVSNPNGVLVEGTVGQPDPGNQCGWTSLADVEAAIRSGNAYVNLHTTAYHPGQIRGQIR